MTLNINDLQFPDKKIIIVEDDIPSIRYYETLLKNTGAEVKIFRNGKDFIDFITHEIVQIDLVLMDFLVPLVNGIECIKIFRKERKDVPVLMLTAYASEQSKKEAFLAGCNEYILKPVYPEKIMALLEKYLKHKKSTIAR
ncbi:MAG TPA: response regulator [Bacteroidales bacterium]|jgi:CheY-like chemotaxis protein|nr:response regulator [Bacteroidales bacterium]HQB36632.1 response regulator [Bacteroidales bacterium]